MTGAQVVDAQHKGVIIKVELSSQEDNAWTGIVILTNSDKSQEKLAPTRGKFAERITRLLKILLWRTHGLISTGKHCPRVRIENGT